MKWLTQWAFTSGVLILIVLAARYLLRDKLSARWRYALWAVVLVRLLAPLQVTLPAQTAQAIPLLASNLAPTVDQWEERSVPVFPQSSRPVNEFNGITFDLMEPGEIMPTETSMGYYQRSADGETITRYLDLWSPEQIVLLIWQSGTAVMVLALLASNLLFARRLKKHGKRLEDLESPVPVYKLEDLPSPCLFGVFRPAVYVTPEAAANPDTLRHVLAHELTHYTHKDHIWSLLRCLALALHWYNPLVWLAVILSKEDGELACDEGAVARLGEAERIPYGRTLVDMVAARSARPADLLSCSTAMTGGKKSIQQRVARLVKRRPTAKTALLAAAAVVALSVVFVFAQRGQPDNTPTMLFDYLSRTTEIRYSPPAYSSTIYPYPLTNEDLLAEAKEALSTFVLLDNDDLQPDLTPREVLREHRITLTFEGGQMEYSLLWQNDRTYLFPGSIWRQSLDLKEEEGETAQLLGVSGTCVSEIDVISTLTDLARQQSGPNHSNPASADLERFQTLVEQAVSVRYCPPLYSSQAYPDPITDTDLLALAKERMGKFVLQDPDTVVTGWYRQMANASRIILSDGRTEAAYALLTGADYRTYLFSGADFDAAWTLKEGETMETAPIARSEYQTDVVSPIADIARLQYERSRDPNFPVPMTREELAQYTPEFLREIGVEQLRGWSDDLEEARFHYGLTAPDHIQLWYWGDNTHNGVWVLALSRDNYTLLADQPMEVFNAAQYAGEEAHYEQLGPGAFAAFLKPEDVVSVTAGDYSPGQAVPVDVPALKEQLIEALYHQFSDEYDREKYGRYVLTIQVEKDVDYYLHDGGEDGLILSAGAEPDVVCLRHRILASLQSESHQYVRSPELYRTIRDLLD